DRVRPEGVAAIAHADGGGLHDQGQRREGRRWERSVLRPQALDQLIRDERQHLDEGDVGRAAARGVLGAVDRVQPGPDEERVSAELPAGAWELPHRVDGRPEAPGAGNAEPELDAFEEDRLVDQVVLELDPDPARVAERVRRVGEHEGLEAVGVPQPHREGALGDGPADVRDIALDVPGRDLRLPLEPPDGPERHAVGVVVCPGRHRQPEDDQRRHGGPARRTRRSSRSTVAASHRPSARDTRAAATMPIATASPCSSLRYSVSISRAWPTVCPKLSTARSPPSSRSSAATTRALCPQQAATTGTRTASSSPSSASSRASSVANSSASRITPYLITSASPATNSRRGRVCSVPTSTTTS